jgi:DNA-binding transcriptional regulator YdaS (Cro superfamily)
METTDNPIIVRAIQACGGSATLAKGLGVSLQMVHKWKRGAAVTAERAVQIEHATGGAVRRHELRPDIFDAPAAVPVCPE